MAKVWFTGLIAILLAAGMHLFYSNIEGDIAERAAKRVTIQTEPTPPKWFVDFWPVAPLRLKQSGCKTHADGNDVEVTDQINAGRPDGGEEVTVPMVTAWLGANCPNVPERYVPRDERV